MLGLTVLAWGNSLGDLVADVSVAKGGEPRMAVAATFAGPLFNLLVGLGVSLLVGVWRSETGVVQLHANVPRNEAIVFTSLLFLAISLLVSLVAVPLNGFRITRGYGAFLLGVYLTFLASALFVQYGTDWA